MNDHDMNDHDVLAAVRVAASEVPMPMRPPLEAIVASGGASRRRRKAALSVAGVAMGAALVLGLSSLIGAGGPAPARTSGPVRLSAFSVVSNANGTTTLTLQAPGGLLDPNAVREALAQHGIRAMVTVGKFCSTHVLVQERGAVLLQGHSIVFDPAAMPASLEVSIGYIGDAQDRTVLVALIKVGAALTCSSIPGGVGAARGR